MDPRLRGGDKLYSGVVFFTPREVVIAQYPRRHLSPSPAEGAVGLRKLRILNAVLEFLRSPCSSPTKILLKQNLFLTSAKIEPAIDAQI